jgi:anti-anti-sigma factor
MTATNSFQSLTACTDDRLTLRWSGECDVAARAIIDNDLSLTEFSRGLLVEVHLGEVTFMDSAGIHTLVVLRDRADRAGARFVVRDASPPVRRVLELTGLAGILASDGTSITDHR